MKKNLGLFLFIAICVANSQAQFRLSPADSIRRDSINRVTQQDYKQMLSRLNITATRPGPSGNPQAPNAANSDESKASPYTSLPDPLTLKNGQKVTTAKTWWSARRPEILDDCDREVYGRLPAHVPGVKWEVTAMTNDTVGGIRAIT